MNQLQDTSSSDVNRCLNVSQLVKSSESEHLIKLIAVFIRMACQPLREKKTKPRLSKASCRVLNLNINHHGKQKGGDMRCSFQKHCWKSIDLSSTVNFDKEKEIYLVYHLGGGQNGDCCLALTRNGKQSCAVKFFFEKATGYQHAGAELKNWKEVYPSMKCHVGELPNNDGYLCMPYLTPVRAAERQMLLDNGEVKKALEQFSASGFLHKAVVWRHIGWFKGKLYLLDLGDIERCATQERRRKWIDDSLQHLKGRVTMTPVNGSKPMHIDGVYSAEDATPQQVEVKRVR